MPNYYRIILGKRHPSVEQCVAQGFVGIDYGVRFLRYQINFHLIEE
jgi:hypothetical protein